MKSITLLLLLLFISIYSSVAGAGVNIGLTDSSNTLVNLSGIWSSGNNQYQSDLQYNFCVINKNSARVLLGYIYSIRFIRYTNYEKDIKYDRIHPICANYNHCLEQLRNTGCLTGTIVLNLPYTNLVKSTNLQESVSVLLLNKGQDDHTPDSLIKYHLVGPI